jgi:hypothetical protein
MIAATAQSSYDEFEETGWRTLAAKDCFFQSGKSIVSWLSAHLDTASDEQVRSLRYQAARVFAMTGRSRTALVHLRHSKDPDQPADAAQDWNAYIGAFSAWLRQDLNKLRTNITKLEAQPVDETGFKPNLIAARRFLVCYGSSYAEIETDPACLKAAENFDPNANASMKIQ